MGGVGEYRTPARVTGKRRKAACFFFFFGRRAKRVPALDLAARRALLHELAPDPNTRQTTRRRVACEFFLGSASTTTTIRLESYGRENRAGSAHPPRGTLAPSATRRVELGCGRALLRTPRDHEYPRPQRQSLHLRASVSPFSARGDRETPKSFRSDKLRSKAAGALSPSREGERERERGERRTGTSTDAWCCWDHVVHLRLRGRHDPLQRDRPIPKHERARQSACVF